MCYSRQGMTAGAILLLNTLEVWQPQDSILIVKTLFMPQKLLKGSILGSRLHGSFGTCIIMKSVPETLVHSSKVVIDGDVTMHKLVQEAALMPSCFINLEPATCRFQKLH